MRRLRKSKWEHKKEEVKNLLLEGRAATEISEITGIPIGSWDYLVVRWNFTGLQVRHTTGLTEAGSKSISEKLAARHVNGLVPSGKKDRLRLHGKWEDPETVEEVLKELVAQDMILKQMAEELEVDPKTITNWLIRFGLQQGMRKGSRCSWYKGGYRKERGPNWLQVREHILERDNHTCTRCGMTASEALKKHWVLHVHHLIPWIETHDNSDENLITLCSSCHQIVEWEYNNSP